MSEQPATPGGREASYWGGWALSSLVIAFMVMDKLTPYHLWKEIVQEHNMALAILVGAMSLGICIIIAAAIH